MANYIDETNAAIRMPERLTMPDGREIGITRWETVEELDEPVRVKVEGFIMRYSDANQDRTDADRTVHISATG